MGWWYLARTSILLTLQTASLHLVAKGVGENSKPVLQNYFCFVRHMIPIFHQSKLISMNERLLKLFFLQEVFFFFKAEFISVRNIENMQHKPNMLITPTLRCLEQDKKCQKSCLLETYSANSNSFSTLVLVADVVVGFS